MTDERITDLKEENCILKAQSDNSSEKELLRALANMPDGTLYQSVKDTQTEELKFVYLSGTWERMSGVSIEDTLANVQNIFVNIHPDDLINLKHNIEEAHRSLVNFKIDIRYNHPVSDKQYWFQINSYPYIVDNYIYSYGFIFDITAGKETEQKLIFEKERLEALGNNLPDGALFQFVLDTHMGHMRMEYVGNKWEEIAGLSAEATLTSLDVFLAMVHPDDLPLVMQNIDESAKALTVFYSEFRITVQGRTRWMQIRSHPYRNGSMIVWDGIMLDITPRKEAVHALETEKIRLQALGDNLPGSALCQFSRDTRTGQMRLLYVSGTWEAVTGVSAEKALKDISQLFDATNPDDLPVIMQQIADSARTMTDHSFEARINDRCIHTVARPRREGVHIIWDGIMTNITDRKETEKLLEAEKKRLQVLSDNLYNSALFQFVRDERTRQMRLSFVSGTWESVTGIPEEVAMEDASKIFATIPADDFPLFLQSIDESAKTLTIHKYEIRFGERWMHIVSRPRNEGLYTYWDGIITNISEQKENEIELNRYRERLEFLVQERTDELNTANEEITATNEELQATNEELYLYKTQLEDMVHQKTQELAMSQKSMRTVLDNIDMHVFVTDFNDYKILFANKKTRDLFGDIDGKECWKVMQKDMAGPCDFCPKKNLLNRNRPSAIGTTHKWEELNSITGEWYASQAVVVEWYDGRLVHLGFATDVTKLKNNEAELTKYRDQLEKLVEERTNELNKTNDELSELLSAYEFQIVKMSLVIEALNVALWDMQIVRHDPVNPQNTFTWSKEFRKLLGYTDKTEFPDVLSSWSDIIHPDDKERVLDAFSRHILDTTGKTPYDVEYRLLKKNGEYGYFRDCGATARDGNGNAIRVAGAIKEV